MGSNIIYDGTLNFDILEWCHEDVLRNCKLFTNDYDTYTEMNDCTMETLVLDDLFNIPITDINRDTMTFLMGNMNMDSSKIDVLFITKVAKGNIKPFIPVKLSNYNLLLKSRYKLI